MDMTLIDLPTLFAKAGFTRWPLLICSMISLAIILERAVYFIQNRFDYQSFSDDLFSKLNRNEILKAQQLAQQFCHPVAHIAAVYLQNHQNKMRECILSREGTLTMERVEKRLRGLAVITHVAPLLGLLGTVGGLVVAFHQIESTPGMIEAKMLAGGIWEALLSTVFGLIVAIPSMIAHHFYESLADKKFRRIQSIIHELDEFFGNNP
ncbi:MAG: MotA/TolQ/ExbB proton channel family protein [Candidatus Omnitrophica bacterium]|nr:MotA/TolQ/ExbB proton channel family protein [Candidatus Omnitrophota bacterium]